MRTALGRYSRKGSTLTSPPRWASWWSRLCKRKGTHISVFISICARIWSLSNLHRRSFWLCVEPLVVITVWSAWFIFDPSEGCQGWWWRPRRWCEPPPTTSTSGPNILGTLWSGLWRILPDLDFRHKERGSNGGLDDGLKVLPRLFATPLDHLEISIHLRTPILIWWSYGESGASLRFVPAPWTGLPRQSKGAPCTLWGTRNNIENERICWM